MCPDAPWCALNTVCSTPFSIPYAVDFLPSNWKRPKKKYHCRSPRMMWLRPWSPPKSKFASDQVCLFMATSLIIKLLETRLQLYTRRGVSNCHIIKKSWQLMKQKRLSACIILRTILRARPRCLFTLFSNPLGRRKWRSGHPWSTTEVPKCWCWECVSPNLSPPIRPPSPPASHPIGPDSSHLQSEWSAAGPWSSEGSEWWHLRSKDSKKASAASQRIEDHVQFFQIILNLSMVFLWFSYLSHLSQNNLTLEKCLRFIVGASVFENYTQLRQIGSWLFPYNDSGCQNIDPENGLIRFGSLGKGIRKNIRQPKKEHKTLCFWLQRYETTRIYTHRARPILCLFVPRLPREMHFCYLSAEKRIFSHGCHTKWCLCCGHMMKIDVLAHFGHAPASVLATYTPLLL